MNQEQADKNLKEFEETERHLISLLEGETLEGIEQKIALSEGEEKEIWRWVKTVKMYYDSRCHNCRGQGMIINPDEKSREFLIECTLCRGTGKSITKAV